MGAPVNHKRIKAKYNPIPTAREKRHHLRVMADGCLVCGKPAVAHHIMQDSKSKRWRRDHELVVPLCHFHHDQLHRNGNEIEWQETCNLDLAWEAETRRLESIHEGIL